MKANRCYVLSAVQVSCQAPLSEEWIQSPVAYEQDYARAMEPDTREFIVPSEARRMSKILKRTVSTSISALNKSGIQQPDAIVTGTGMGCMENSEKFLMDLSKFGENCLKPTLFMQSTHNTISSLIGIILKCHGYNNTYSHKGLSFESALLDAWLQIKSGEIRNALVGSHDEVTPLMALILNQTHPDYRFISESSVSAVLAGQASCDDALCEVEDVKILYKPTQEELAAACAVGPDTALMMGVNGMEANDAPYLNLLNALDTHAPLMHYKHLFGENFSSPAIAFYASVMVLAKGEIPQPLLLKPGCDTSNIRRIKVVNHSDRTAWSVVTLAAHPS